MHLLVVLDGRPLGCLTILVRSDREFLLVGYVLTREAFSSKPGKFRYPGNPVERCRVIRSVGLDKRILGS